MRTTVILLIAALLAAIGGSAAGTYFRSKAPPPSSLTSTSSPKLIVRDSDLDFGEVWETDRHKHVIHVTNPGGEPVPVYSWQTSCDCHKVEPESVIIQPGETLPIRLTLNLMSRISESWTEKPRGISIQCNPRFGDGAARDGWKIAGTVVPFYRLIEEPGSRELSELGQPFLPHWQNISFLIPVREVIAQADPLITSAKVIAPIDGQGTYRVGFQWQNKLTLGSHNATVRIQARRVDGSALPEIALAHRLDVVEDVRATPSRLLIPNPAAGEWVSHQIQFHSLRGCPESFGGGGRDSGTGRVSHQIQFHSLSGRHVQVKQVDDLPIDPDFVVEMSGGAICVRIRGIPERFPFKRVLQATVDSSGKIYKVPVQVVVG